NTAAPAITSVSPNSGQQGQTNLIVTVNAVNTHFVFGTTTASFGAGITVNSVIASGSTVAIVNITISASAVLGARDVTLTTGAEVVTEAGAFTVNAAVVTAS